MATVRDILERARAAGETIPQPEAAALFSAAMRLSAKNLCTACSCSGCTPSRSS